MNPWGCEVCGEFDNNRESWRERCVHCGNPAGTWQCACGALNWPSDKVCHICKVPKPPPEE